MNRYKKGWITCSLKLQQIITANRNVLYVLWAYKIIVNKSDLANQVQSGFTIFTTQGFSNSREQSRLETIGYRRFGLQIWTMYMHFPLSLLYKLTCKSEICWQDISWAFYVNFAKTIFTFQQQGYKCQTTSLLIEISLSGQSTLFKSIISLFSHVGFCFWCDNELLKKKSPIWLKCIQFSAHLVWQQLTQIPC